MALQIQKRQTESSTTLHDDNIDEIEETIEDKTKKLTLKGKLIEWKNLITVEPILFSYIFASTLALGAVQNLSFEMGCRVNLGLNDTVCSDISLGLKYVAVLRAQVHAWTHPISTAVPGILVLCFGSFSDRYKLRKPFFILPSLGEVFSCIGLMFCAYNVASWPIEVYAFMGSIIPAFFGGGQTLILAIYSYITDISTVEERTSRIGFVELVSLVLTPIGPALSGILYEKIGYYGVLSICLLLFLFSALYGIFAIKESINPVERKKNLCIDVFNIKVVLKDMIKIIFQKRMENKRALLILSYICYILIKGPIAAEATYIIFYAIQEFEWKLDTFGYFNAFDVTIHIFGMIIAITLFTKKFHMNDIIITAMACIFKMISGLWYAFGTSVVMFCIGPLISVFSGLYVIALRSVVTKLVNQTEIAKAQAVFAICDALVPILYSSIYSKCYEATHSSFHGAFFIFSVILLLPALFVLLGMNAAHKNGVTKQKNILNTTRDVCTPNVNNEINNVVEITHI